MWLLGKKKNSPEDGRSKRVAPSRHAPSTYAQVPPARSSQCRTRGVSAHPMTTRFPWWIPIGACVVSTSETLTIWASSAWNKWRACAMRRAAESSEEGVRDGTSNVSGAFVERMDWRRWGGARKWCVVVANGSVHGRICGRVVQLKTSRVQSSIPSKKTCGESLRCWSPSRTTSCYLSHRGRLEYRRHRSQVLSCS